jgi:hypothetical protein
MTVARQTIEKETNMVAEETAPQIESIKLDITNNWTGRDELPFEPIAERTLAIEAEGEAGPLTVTFARPVLVEGLGWACVFRMSAMGRVHASPARGVDAVDALQAAFAMVGKQLAGMGRMHRITFNGSEELGFAPAAAGAAAKAAGCPVMSGSL